MCKRLGIPVGGVEPCLNRRWRHAFSISRLYRPGDFAEFDLISGRARVRERARGHGRHTPRSAARAANVRKRLDIPIEEAEPCLNRRRWRVFSIPKRRRSCNVILLFLKMCNFRAKTLFLKEIEQLSRRDRFRRDSNPSKYIFRGLQTAATRAVDLERHEMSLGAPWRAVFLKISYLGLKLYFSKR